MAWENPLQSGFKSHSHKRRNARFKRLRRVHTPPHLLTAHTAAYTAKQGAFRMGALSLPSDRFARFGTPAWPGVRTANFAAFGPWSGRSRRAQRAFVTAMRMMRVAVTRRRGPAGLRDPIAVPLTALIGFTVLADRDYSVRKKAHFVFMRRAVLPALPAPSAALLHALMH